MKCPNCEETLIMSERQEIDYCPKCRGVWLDRGELDKIIEKSMPVNPSAEGSSYNSPKYDDNHKHYKKRKGNFLSDLFD